MTDGAKKTPSIPSLAVHGDDERSVIRARVENEERSLPESAPAPRRRIDSTPTISLDERISHKARTIAALLERLPPDDAYTRLIHIALLRRDEALLDGVLAALSQTKIE